MHAATRNNEDRELTLEEYLALPEDPLYRYELVRGWLVKEPRPLNLHGWVVMELGSRLAEYVRPKRLGYVMTESGFLLEQQPPTVRGPDISYVVRERVPAFPAIGYLHRAPDLAVEVLSPSDRAGAMRRKVQEYLATGAQEVWVVDPATRTVTVQRTGAAPRVLTTADRLDGGAVLPGFHVAVAELFTL